MKYDCPKLVFNINILGQHSFKPKPQPSPGYGDGYGFGHDDGNGDGYSSTNNHYQGIVLNYYLKKFVLNSNILGQHSFKPKPKPSPGYGDGYGFGHEDGHGDVYGSTNNHYQGIIFNLGLRKVSMTKRRFSKINRFC